MKKIAILGLLFALAACSIAQSIRFFNASGGFEIRAGNRFPYDRVARGELLRILATKGSGTSYTIEAWLGNRLFQGPLPLNPNFNATFRVPTDPGFDNCRVIIKKAGRAVLERRVPIGVRR